MSSSLAMSSAQSGGEEGSPVEAYVKAHGGTHVITKVLVANNGLAAVKAIRSIRAWCYKTFQDDRAVRLVAMATPDDLKINAEYIRLADEFVEVPGGPGNNNYSNVQLVVSLAKRIQAHAVWPGWGYASENPALPEACAKENIVFIGPSAASMSALGDKIASTIIAQSSDVPCIPWSGAEVRVSSADELTDEVFKKACVKNFEEAKYHAEIIGFPLMIKASEGGGGKGIRKVLQLDDLEAAYRQVLTEVPGSPVFLMRMGVDCHHLEVQILADRYGNTVALDGRDCSVQRRHQKLIEEGPATICSREQFHDMEASAVRLAKSVGYSVAGTVEFLYTDGHYYFLEMNPRLQVEHPVTEGILGINLPACMLCVAMGIPLNRIPDIRSFYGHDDDEDTEIDFDNDQRREPEGHVIAARITAENADNNFQPTSGSIQELTFRSTSKAWAYFSVGSSGGIHEFSDSQFGHVFAYGADRVEAQRNLIVALKGMTVLGDIRYTVEVEIEILEHPAFLSNAFNTSWLDTYIVERNTERDEQAQAAAAAIDSDLESVSSMEVQPSESQSELDNESSAGSMSSASSSLAAKVHSSSGSDKQQQQHSLSTSSISGDDGPSTRPLKSVGSTSSGLYVQGMSPTLVAITCGAATRGYKELRAHKQDLYASLERGQLPSDESVQTYFDTQIIFEERKYVFKGCISSPNDLVLMLNGTMAAANVRSLSDGGLLISLGGQSFVCYTREEKTGFRMEINGRTFSFVTQEVDPRTLRTSSAGKLYRYLVPNGTQVSKDDPVAEIEVMKMLLTLKAQVDGVITFTKSEGTFVDTDDVIARMQLAQGTVVKQSQPSLDTLPKQLDPLRVVPPREGVDVDLALEERSLLKYAVTVLSGYQPSPESHVLSQKEVTHRVVQLEALLRNPQLSLFHFNEVLSPLTGRIPPELYTKLEDCMQTYSAMVAEDTSTEFPFETMQTALQDYLASLGSASDRNAAQSLLTPLMDFLRSHKGGPNAYLVRVTMSLLKQYYDVASQFDHDWPYEDIVNELRVHFKDQPDLVHDLLRSHAHVEAKNQLVLGLLQHVVAKQIRAFLPMLEKLESLRQPVFADVSIHSKYLMLSLQSEDYSEQVQVATEKLRHVAELLEATKPEQAGQVLAPYVQDEHDQVREDILIRMLAHSETQLSFASMQTFIRRQYAEYQILDVECKTLELDDAQPVNLASWQYELAEGASLSSSVLNRASREQDTGPQIWRIDSVDSMAASGLVRSSPTIGAQGSGSLAAMEAEAESAAMAAAAGADVFNAPRRGFLVAWSQADDVEARLDALLTQLLAQYAPSSMAERTQNAILYVVLGSEQTSALQDDEDDDELVARLEKLFVEREENLAKLGVRRVSLVLLTPEGEEEEEQPMRIFTFRSYLGFKEDAYVRHIEPTMADYLELPRLSQFELSVCPTNKTNIHIYQASAGMHTDGGVMTMQARRRSFAKMGGSSVGGSKESKDRFFARCIIPLAKGDASHNVEIVNFVEMHLLRAVSALEYAQARTGITRASGAHIFLNMLGSLSVDLQALLEGMDVLVGRMVHLLAKQDVQEVEVAVSTNEGDEQTVRRVFLGFAAGVCVTTDVYTWTESGWVAEELAHARVYSGQVASPSAPYPVASKLAAKRTRAQVLGTSYAYDFPILLESAVAAQWAAAVETRVDVQSRPAEPLVELEEIVVQAPGGEGVQAQSSSSALAGSPVTRDTVTFALKAGVPPGTNTLGMVGWLITMRTPEYPQGRRVVMLANDITVVSGSFGVLEDKLYEYGSDLARSLRVPLLYVAANSGARIGLAKEVIGLFKVAWKDAGEPGSGFEYIYLDAGDYGRVMQKHPQAIVTEEVTLESGEVRYRITDIIGTEDGIGVENLRGSGTIASQMSAAYDEVVTLSYVTGRAVGIGAYLVRLGQRVVQLRTAPILLTGFAALNRLVGHHVYTSNLQIGGPKIMFRNGVSHLTVNNDLEGMGALVNWLSFLPAKQRTGVPVVPSADAVDRQVAFVPQKGEAYNPRALLQGVVVEGGAGSSSSSSSSADAEVDDDVASVSGMSVVPAGMSGVGDLTLSLGSQGVRSIASGSLPDVDASGERLLRGFFDQGSFVETLSAWAETVVCGRARLGGIPTGVIAVETRTVQRIRPADPADEMSNEHVVQQPGQVWFPDSAYKTAQAIQDFSKEGLPLVIFANWRGFSGGMRDMFDEVLKYGSYIVDNLRTYTQPVFVYLPPYAELRGGAWVVLDATINGDMMEMYADPRARAGILEPEGIQSIKFRGATVRATMLRTDEQCKSLAGEIAELEAEMKQDEAAREQLSGEVSALKKKLAERQDELFPVYQQLATHFCALHDTPVRMHAKGVIEHIVQWEESRQWFFWRMRRRLLEHEIVQSVDGLAYAEGLQKLRAWVAEQLGMSVEEAGKQNEAVATWLMENEAQVQGVFVKSLKVQAFAARMQEMMQEDAMAAAEALVHCLQALDVKQRAAFLVSLQDGMSTKE